MGSWGWGSLAQRHGPSDACLPKEGGAGTRGNMKKGHTGPSACSILCHIGHYQQPAGPGNHAAYLMPGFCEHRRPPCHKPKIRQSRSQGSNCC